MTRAHRDDGAADAYWSLDPAALLRSLGARREGLASDEVAARRAVYGPNALDVRESGGFLSAFVAQLKNPLAWLLAFAVGVSSFAREWTDASVILAILLASALMSAVQEHRASRAVDALRSRVALRATVLRDGRETSVAVEELVPGDVLQLEPGAMIAADAVVLEARDFEVSQAVLTGETFPVEKTPAPSPRDAPLAARANVAFQGTSVRSGRALALVVRTGRDTEYGHVAQALSTARGETEFESGIRRFGYLLTRVMVVLVAFTFAATVLAHKPAIDSLLFAIALAVGLAPEMLPAVIAVNLSHGAHAMAERGVIVRRLTAIENLGAMSVLCTDKTGTLTEGAVRVERSLDAFSCESTRPLWIAATNARLHAGLRNPLDEALAAQSIDGPAVEKLDEVVYDFVRKRVSVAVRYLDAVEPAGPRTDARVELLTKGALAAVLSSCAHVRDAQGAVRVLDPSVHARIEAQAAALGAEGFRVLGVASRAVPLATRYTRDDERDMVFEGVVTFLDPPKRGAEEAVRALEKQGVRVHVVSGDARAVAVHLAARVGIAVDGVLTGAELQRTSDESLRHLAPRTTVFAEVDPNQKERVIRALRAHAVVGYMGDGINDAPALRAADVAISVEGAVDVAREAADFVLLRQDLGVLRDGIETGRKTFANTLKYLFTTESANFGNMLSMAVAAAFLPFLPLLASQVLLNNFLSDLPAMTIGADAVDAEQLERPRRWNLRELRDFMLVFGVISSAFDLLTFALLLWVVRAPEPVFRTGWFLVSLLTEVVVALVVRTRRRFYQSRPSPLLLATSLGVVGATLLLIYAPLGRAFSLVPLAPRTVVLLGGVALAYAFCVELVKQFFFSRLGARASGRSTT